MICPKKLCGIFTIKKRDRESQRERKIYQLSKKKKKQNKTIKQNKTQQFLPFNPRKKWKLPFKPKYADVHSQKNQVQTEKTGS